MEKLANLYRKVLSPFNALSFGHSSIIETTKAKSFFAQQNAVCAKRSDIFS